MKKAFIIIMLAILYFTGFSFAENLGNTTIQSFNKAKRTLLQQVYNNKGRTFYCGCPFGGKEILACENYTPKKDSKRARRVEFEHIVAAEHFGQSFKEWREGHPECIDSKEFQGKELRQENGC